MLNSLIKLRKRCNYANERINFLKIIKLLKIAVNFY